MFWVMSAAIQTGFERVLKQVDEQNTQKAMLSDTIWLEIYTLLICRKQDLLSGMAETTSAEVLSDTANQMSYKGSSNFS